jgi:hypothetical protein
VRDSFLLDDDGLSAGALAAFENLAFADLGHGARNLFVVGEHRERNRRRLRDDSGGRHVISI